MFAAEGEDLVEAAQRPPGRRPSSSCVAGEDVEPELLDAVERRSDRARG